MAGTNTPNLNLYKADPSEYYDVTLDINDNMQKIDTAVGNLSNLPTTNKNSLVESVTELNSNIISMGKIKFFQPSSAASVTLNLPSASSHFIIIGTNNRAVYAVLMVVVVTNDAVQVAEISKGANITIDNSVAGKLTVTFDAARQAGIYDMVIRGENATM